jgi:DNA polymerase epsilon subunit 1
VSDCASCEFNQEKNDCKRLMEWTWRGDVSPADTKDWNRAQAQLSLGKERFSNPITGEDGVAYSELPHLEQVRLARVRVKQYAQRAYKRTKDTRVEQRVDTVCMRENPFYVDTVRAFRDRRYEYKLATKQWKKKKTEADKAGDAVAHREASDKEVLMDSLQLAHKCILNSFYGYVMRKGARWKSMQMAGRDRRYDISRLFPLLLSRGPIHSNHHTST